MRARPTLLGTVYFPGSAGGTLLEVQYVQAVRKALGMRDQREVKVVGEPCDVPAGVEPERPALPAGVDPKPAEGEQARESGAR